MLVFKGSFFDKQRPGMAFFGSSIKIDNLSDHISHMWKQRSTVVLALRSFDHCIEDDSFMKMSENQKESIASEKTTRLVR